MSKFTFKFEEQTVGGGKSVSMECDTFSLNTVLNQFTDFLKGCGYQIDGYVDVVKPSGKVSDKVFQSIDPLNPDTWPNSKNMPPIVSVDLSSSSYSNLPPSSVAPLTKEQLAAFSSQSIPSIDLSSLNAIKPIDFSSLTTPSITTFHHPV